MPSGPARLAIHGGSPVRTTLLPYGRQSIDDDDIREVVAVLRSDWLTTGPKVAEFEEAFAAYVGSRHAVSFSSGTAALHGAVFAAGLGPGDEAITSPLTFCATANCALYVGATPVFADVARDTLTLDPAATERAVTAQTKAVLPVDYAGHPADLDAIRRLSERHGLTVIEDACHALGAGYHGRRVGALGHMTVFSFHPVKHITTGEGGMVTTDDATLAGRLRAFRSHGIESHPRERQVQGQWFYEMQLLGYNYRLSDIASALGLSQLRRIEGGLARRREIAARYTVAFREIDGVIPPACRAEVSHAWHFYPVRFESAGFRVDRDEIFRALRGEGIGVNVHYVPVHLHPFYRERFGFRGGEYPMAEAAYAELVTLPLFPGLSDRDVDDVVEAVTKVAEFYRA